MPERGQKTEGLKTHDIPAISSASFGLGSLLLAIEGDRLSVLRHVDISESYAYLGYLALAIMIGLFAWQRKDLDSKKHQTILILIVGAFYTASLLGLAEQGIRLPIEIPYDVCRSIGEICQGLLFFFWVRTCSLSAQKQLPSFLLCLSLFSVF